jgi:hypothetical protein
MKRFWILLSLLPITIPISSYGQTATEILTRYEQATGFRNRLKVNTLISIGQTSQLGNTLPVSIIQKRPNKYRFDVHLNEGRITQAFDGVHGWAFNPFSGQDTLPLEGAELAQIKESADFDGILHTYRERGLDILLEGKDMVGPREAWKLKIRKPSGEVMTFFIDSKSYLLIKSNVGLLINRMPYMAESTFADFRRVAGMVLPYHIQTRNGSMLTETQIDTVRVNEPIEDFYFEWKNSR